MAGDASSAASSKTASPRHSEPRGGHVFTFRESLAVRRGCWGGKHTVSTIGVVLPRSILGACRSLAGREGARPHRRTPERQAVRKSQRLMNCLVIQPSRETVFPEPPFFEVEPDLDQGLPGGLDG